MSLTWACEQCDATVSAVDMDGFVAAITAHGRSEHEWPFSDMAIRNYAEATQRATGSTQRLESIGAVEVHRVTADRIDDWLTFFDRDAFADNLAWAGCYCTEPHVLGNEQFEGTGDLHWSETRRLMEGWLRVGSAGGYLAYVDGRAGGWVNATLRRDYSRWRLGADASPPDADVLAIACFVIAPPYRRHGLASRLLEGVVAEAPHRGARVVEAYPRPDAAPDAQSGLSSESMNYHGPYELFARHGFEPAGSREDGRFTVVRLAV